MPADVSADATRPLQMYVDLCSNLYGRLNATAIAIDAMVANPYRNPTRRSTHGTIMADVIGLGIEMIRALG